MSLVQGVNNPAIDNLIQSSLDKYLRLEWIPCSQITNIKLTPTDEAYYASRYGDEIILVFLGNSEECTTTFVSGFARIYSLPTHKHNNNSDNFRRYSTWLEDRNRLIKGFTKYDNNYYMVVKRQFYHCYSRYGFCAVCGILRVVHLWT